MADITKVSERGQTAIPARLRREHGVGPGTELVWEAVSPDEWRVHISRKPIQAPDPAAMRGFARRFRAVRTTQEWMRDLREGEADSTGEDDLK
jgi:bifunctional DNA-binding transcriptional regulator/antitoxin component of YhaV-PrlF toxin-antitoxin module